MSIAKVFEVIDTSSDECYFPIGIFTSFDKAKTFLLTTLPGAWPDNNEDEYASAEIKERDVGRISGLGKSVFAVDYKAVINEETDEAEWQIDKIYPEQ